MVDNTVTIVGTITMDPELRTTNSGMSVLDINFAGPKKRRLVLFSYFMLNEQLDKFKILSVFIGFIGVLITVRPDIESINLGLIAAAISAIVFALTFTRRG